MLALRGYHVSGGEMVLFTAILLAVSAMIVTIPVSAYATYESDYKYGYQGGESEWSSCATTDGEGDCTVKTDYCSAPIMGTIPVYIHTATVHEHVYQSVNLGNVTNMTACIRGFIHGWNHVCDPAIANERDNRENGIECPMS